MLQYRFLKPHFKELILKGFVSYNIFLFHILSNRDLKERKEYPHNIPKVDNSCNKWSQLQGM
ncbi:hypothetical protein E2320_019507, partial [Naja naja]